MRATFLWSKLLTGLRQEVLDEVDPYARTVLEVVITYVERAYDVAGKADLDPSSMLTEVDPWEALIYALESTGCRLKQAKDEALRWASNILLLAKRERARVYGDRALTKAIGGPESLEDYIERTARAAVGKSS